MSSSCFARLAKAWRRHRSWGYGATRTPPNSLRDAVTARDPEFHTGHNVPRSSRLPLLQARRMYFARHIPLPVLLFTSDMHIFRLVGCADGTAASSPTRISAIGRRQHFVCDKRPPYLIPPIRCVCHRRLRPRRSRGLPREHPHVLQALASSHLHVAPHCAAEPDAPPSERT